MQFSQSEQQNGNAHAHTVVYLIEIILSSDFCYFCRYEHYDEQGGFTRSQSKKNRSQDPFSDKYFDIMDRVQELNLVSGNETSEAVFCSSLKCS